MVEGEKVVTMRLDWLGGSRRWRKWRLEDAKARRQSEKKEVEDGLL